MRHVRIYTSPSCMYCVLAKRLLASLNVAYEEIDISRQPELRAQLQTMHQWSSVPMIFFGETFMGGYDDINRLHQRGELEARLTT